MPSRYIRLAAILVQTLYCLALFGAGFVTGVPFFYTFIGPALLLTVVAFCPRFLYDVAAAVTIIIMLMLALVFAAAAFLFNHDFLPGLAAAIVPAVCLAALLFAMERLKREDPAYT